MRTSDAAGKRAPVTLDEVARLSGVSRAAASRSLNGRDGVRPDVRERVQRVADTLGYRANRAAKNLASGRSSVIGLVIPSDELRVDPYSASLVQAVSDAADKYDEGLMLLLARSEPTRSVRNTLLDGLIDGVIISSIALGVDWIEDLFDAHIPTVLIGAHPSRTDVHRIEVECFEVTARMVDHLIADGRQRIANITGQLSRDDARQRAAGFRVAFERRGVEVDESLIRAGRFTRQAARKYTAELLDVEPALVPDAIVCANDEMAIGAIDVIESLGYRVPQDIAVTGFDGTSSDEGFDLPPDFHLTTVTQPFGEIADAAVATLISILAGKQPPVRQLIDPTLTIGASSRLHAPDDSAAEPRSRPPSRRWIVDGGTS